MMKYLNKMSPFLLHLMVIYSVFDIYFKSPILQIKEPSSPQHQAAARRLVVFVADGLRAQSFYKARAAPFLHQTRLLSLRNKILTMNR
ncbi:GPI ethanolamine phosphate transferase 1 [Eurytemora carolleeae]|uniref:GPI ethanolamine phosphate transferase 1 n=1 Tax=Eurytemora carolleeae TaxID=1294199 RepID=UPI000C7758B3|nr:GPI ethanolamine phosphate transferase 1 [Eurytemora carolleeae]|eukprot:XP_023344906.1 GPI ethanolamine phosphate transferase 1-like [Eurytemora affinis]